MSLSTQSMDPMFSSVPSATVCRCFYVPISPENMLPPFLYPMGKVLIEVEALALACVDFIHPGWWWS